MSRFVLLAEDNPSDEKLALRAFAKCGVPTEIVVVRDGAEVLDFLFGTGKHAGRDVRTVPAVVLLDINMPLVGGLEVLRRVRADPRTRAVPIVVLTSSTEEEDLEHCYEHGANAYVRKPVDFPDFVDKAKVLSTFWLELNEAPGRP